MAYATQKYGNNRWWESKELEVIGYYQLKEEILIVDSFRFLMGIDMLLGRNVSARELEYNFEGIIEEAEKAWCLLIGFEK